MGNKIGLFALNPAPADFPATVREVARELVPADGFIGRFGRKDYGAWACFVIEDENYAYAPEWCQALTMKTGGLGLSVFVFEWNWDFNIFHAGNHLAGRDSTPDPVLMGDLDAAARALGVPRDLFTDYCVSPLAGLSEHQAEDDDLVEDLMEKHSGHRAYEGDTCEPWDEWGFCDLVKKVGFEYPDPDDRTAIEVHPEGTAVGPRDWSRLPPRLSEADVVFKATRPPAADGDGARKKPW